MRFNGFDPAFALLRAGDGRPFKVDAIDALFLPDRVYQYNDQLFSLLVTAFDNNDRLGLESLWSAAHQYVRPMDSGPMSIVKSPMSNVIEEPFLPLPPELK